MNNDGHEEEKFMDKDLSLVTWLGLTPEQWDSAMIISLIAVALVAAGVAVLTYGSVRSNKLSAKVSADQFERYKSETARRVADAATAGLKAQEAIARANVEIAHSNERAELAHADAAQARLETAQISLQLEDTKRKLNDANAIHPLSHKTIKLLEEEMRGFVTPASASLIPSAPNDREAEFIAVQIREALHSAGVSLSFGSNNTSYTPNGSERGQIIIAFGAGVPDSVAEDLSDRFVRAGLQASTLKLPSDTNPEIEKIAQNFLEIRVVSAPRTSY